MALVFGKIVSFNGSSLQEASADIRPHTLSVSGREHERETSSGRRDSHRLFKKFRILLIVRDKE